jgi:hypothetical protein
VSDCTRRRLMSDCTLTSEAFRNDGGRGGWPPLRGGGAGCGRYWLGCLRRRSCSAAACRREEKRERDRFVVSGCVLQGAPPAG